MRIALSVAKYAIPLAIIGALIAFFQFRPVSVESSLVRRGEIERTVMGTGTLEARIQVTISPKVAGRIAEVLVDQGDLVEQGDVLVRLDDADLAQQVRMAQSTVATTEASIGRFQAEMAQAESKLTKATLDFERTKQLQSTLSQSEIDQAKEAYDIALSGMNRAKASLLEAEHQVDQAKSSLAYYEARLSDATLPAPFSGMVIDRERDPGAIAVPGTPLLKLISLEELWISAWVDETEMDSLQEGQEAQVVFRSQPNKAFQGKITRLGKLADRETREFVVDVTILELPENWAIGQRAEVYITVDRKADGLFTEPRFVVRRDRGLGVYVAREGVAHWQPVQLGLQGRKTVELLEGVQEGDSLVLPIASKSVELDGRAVSK